jgi:hypothetical protein
MLRAAIASLLSKPKANFAPSKTIVPVAASK